MNSTGFYGVSKWHKALSASLTAFALVLSSVAPLLAFPQVAHAVADPSSFYEVTGSIDSIIGQTLNISGTAKGDPQKGADGTQHMAVDWDEDQDGDPTTGLSQWGIDGLTFTPVFSDCYDHSTCFLDSHWTASHLYSAGGSYTVSVIVYHGNTPGEDGDALSTITLDVEIPSSIGGLIVQKVLVNDNGGTVATSSFSFQIPGVNAGNPIFFEEDGSNEFVLEAGSYSVTEVSTPGYGVTYSAGCTAGVSAGATTTCTITNNDQPGTLIVKKTLTKDNGSTANYEDFAFQMTGGATTTFNVSGENSISVDAGTYSVVEVQGTEPLSGYTTSYDNCSNISVANGETEICTITNNDLPASIKIFKEITNIEGRGLKTDPSEFSYFVDLEQVMHDVAEFFNFKSTPYVVTEEGADGYNVSFGGNCASDGSLSVALGGSYTCTITNTQKEPGVLHVIKVVQNDNAEGFEGTAVSGDFNLSVSGGNPVPASFAGSAEGVDVVIDAGASYTVSEDSFAGYHQVSMSDDCEGVMPEGGERTCTIVNNDNVPEQAYLTVMKTITNDNGGLVEDQDAWTLTATNSESVVTPLSHGSAVLVDPQTYTIGETGGPDGYEQTSVTCSVDGGSEVAGNSVVVEAGHSYVCTITNDDVAPSLTVVKALDIQYGGTASESDWTVGASGPSVISGAGSVSSGGTFQAGTYTLSESGGPESGYTAGEWSCNNEVAVDENNQITLALGEETTCTITNYDLPGTLYVIKNVINDNGGEADPSDFTMYVDGTDVSDESFPGTDEEPGYLVTLDAGAYSVSEDGPSGYGMTASEECSGEIANGETKVCTLTNDDGKATLTIAKYTEGADGSFTISVTGQEDITLATEQGFASASLALDAGTYDVTELVPTGWTLSSSYCEYDNEEEVGEPAQNGETVTLGVGADVTCSFYNYATGADLSIEKSVDDATPDADQTLQFTLTVTNSGPATANNVSVLDALPSGLTYVSDDSEGEYSTTTGAWTVGSLLDGESATLVITATVSASAGQTVVNTASVSFEDEGVSDYVEENNDDEISVTVNTPSGGGGGGSTPPPPVLGGGITGLGGGSVLGASTVGQVLGESCGLFMDQYLRRGNAKNRADQVTKLQEFLVKHGYGTFTPTGFFGPLTEGAVKAFQAEYAQNVLAPWGLSAPTGLAYLTTLRQLNLIECPELSLTIPELVEWSRNPAVQ
ncbi:MAG: peptidoglycan-binding protein [Patescibacteria group bacterium]